MSIALVDWLDEHDSDCIGKDDGKDDGKGDHDYDNGNDSDDYSDTNYGIPYNFSNCLWATCGHLMHFCYKVP